jgi:hypothetical protein
MPKIQKSGCVDFGHAAAGDGAPCLGWRCTALGGGATTLGYLVHTRKGSATLCWVQVWLRFLTLGQPKLALFFSFSSPTSPSRSKSTPTTSPLQMC